MPQRLSSLPSLLQGLLVLVALFAAPLLFEPWTYEQYLLPKYTAAAGLGILLALLLWTRACAGQLVRLPLHAVNRWLALFLLWNLVLWPLAQSPSLAADRVLWLAAVLVISWAWQEWAGQRPRRILLAAWCLAASAGATALWALWQDASIHWGWAGTAGLLNRLGDWRGVVVAGLGNSDYTAMFLAIAYLPLLLLMLFTRSRIQAAALLLTLWLTAAALIVTWSVGNNGALILGALVLATCIRKHFGHLWHKAGRRILIWTAGCLLIIAWLSTNNPLNPHQRADDGLPGIFGEAFASERWIAGGPTRGVIWFNSFEMIRQNQILGVGPGNFSYVYPATISSAMPDDPDWQKYQGLYTNAAHNTLLQIWAELGPIGALLLILIVAAAFGDLWRKAHGAQGARPVERWIAWAGFAALAVFCGASIMSFPLQLPSSTILFFALLPLGPMLGDPEREEGGFRMPALTLEGRVATIVFRLKNMKNLVAVEGRFDLPVWGRGVLILAGAILAAVLLFQTAQPFRADVLYNEGRLLEKQGRRDQAEVLFRKGLEIDPDHQDLRSHYSSFLLEEGRYQEVVGQMDTLFKRLNSTELYLRRAKAYQALGLTAQAQRDLEEYYRRAPFQQMLKTP